jgi:hypothetical protein
LTPAVSSLGTAGFFCAFHVGTVAPAAVTGQPWPWTFPDEATVNKDQVKQKILSLVAAMKEETELRNQLLAINFVVSSEKEVEAAMKKQTELIKGIETLRAQKILPVVEEMATFVGSKQKAAKPGSKATPAKGAVPAKPGAKAAPAKPAAAPAKPAAKPAAPAPKAKGK